MRWKPIPFAPVYSVSDTGLVRRGSVLMALQASKGRYNRVALRTTGGKRLQCLVCRLVAKAFLPTPLVEASTVDHRDGNSFNDSASNLRWVSASENARLMQQRRGALTPEQAVGVKAAAAAGESYSSIARRMHRSPGTIHQLVQGDHFAYVQGAKPPRVRNPRRFTKGRVLVCDSYLTDEAVVAMREAAAAGESLEALQARSGRDARTIIRILRHQRYQHAGGPILSSTYGALRQRRFNADPQTVPSHR